MRDDVDHHEFLVSSDGDLTDSARRIPDFREYVEDLPETAATFRLKHVSDDLPGVQGGSAGSKCLEFVGAWPLPETHKRAEANGRLWVNPGHIHAHKYPSVTAECECGAKFSRVYKDGDEALRNEQAHEDDCLPQWRLEARAEVHRQRMEIIERCCPLGLTSQDIKARLGLTRSSMGRVVRQYHMTFEELRDEYRRLAANTYVLLALMGPETATDMAELYGHATNTLSRWVDDYSDFERQVPNARKNLKVINNDR